ncbi:hypothetical protein SVAN01_06900 [Stagonosporopsis vannaccii]|nr:hypothetical protein SVAN01_06900 [Stagonosporopsis vannaccii]
MLSTTRKKHRKVRTGCRTCKLRRVKCDESYPACLRCFKLGQICDGYGVWGGGGVHKHARDTRDPSLPDAQDDSITASPLRYGPTTTPGLRVSSDEQIYLEWFIHGTTATPPRIFKSSFWDPAILQASANEPMILQALLALSAAHKRHVLEPIDRARAGLAPDGPEIFLLRHYGNALRGLQAYLNDDGDMPRSKLFTAASMCAIFVLLSLLRGRFDEASVHLKTGAFFAKQLIQEPSRPNQLAQSLTRLQDQTTLFHNQTSTSRFMAIRLFSPSTFELRFASPTEAAHYLDDLVEQVAYLAQQERQIPRSATAAIKMHRNICRYLLSCFESWSNACNATITERGLTLTPDDVSIYKALRQRYQVAKAMAERCIGSLSAIEA